MPDDWGEAGWEWYQAPRDFLGSRDRDEKGRIWPRYWRDPRLGLARRGAPVVGISWYEANAYCRWLQRHWDAQPERAQNPGLQPALIRLPTEAEWAAAAGGETPEGRYPWDKPGDVTKDEATILARANVKASGLNRTTPVGMYPLGASPAGVWDMGGNVWEWQANYRNVQSGWLALWGGAYYVETNQVRASSRYNYFPYFRNYYFGFRVVVLPQVRQPGL